MLKAFYYICLIFMMKKTISIFSFWAIMLSAALLTAQTIDRLPCIDKTFSVVVHIVQDSLGNANITQNAILKDFDSLNVRFAPICVSFEICEFRYIVNDLYDTIRIGSWDEMQTLYHVENRINVFYANDIKYPDPAACGFAGFGAIGNLNSEGIVIKKGCDENTLAHELGHYFGLPHTFEPNGAYSAELADGSNCLTTGDQICDTPADPFVKGDSPAAYVNSGCEFISMKKDANGDYYDALPGNIMSYYPDACKCGFTHDQYKTMADTYLSNTGMW